MMSRIALVSLLAASACAHGSPAYLAKVNDELVTGKELRAEFARHHAAMDRILGSEEDVRTYLGRLVDRRLFVQEAYRMGLEEAPDVRESVARARGQRLVELYLREEVEAHASVTEAEVQAIHAGLTEQLKVRQLALPTRQAAEAARAALAGGADFEAMARQRSTAESASRGGLLVVGWGAEEIYETTLAALKEGQLSPVIQSSQGWEVLKLEQRITVERPAYEKVSGRIRQILHKRKQTAREHALYGELWARHQVKVLDCAPTVAALTRAAAERPAEPCATWTGGAITVEALAKRVKIDQVTALGDRWPGVRQAVVEDLVARQLAQAEAEARGLGSRPEVVEKVRAHQDDLVESRLYRDHVVKGVEASDGDARAWYQAHLGDFMQDAQLELAQILVKTEADAAEVQARLAARQPFAEVATAWSKDPTTVREGGRVGFVEKKTLVGPLAPVAALAEGEVSAPLQTEAGYHLVKVLSTRSAVQRPFEEVTEEARRLALQAKQKTEIDRWVKTLRAAARVEISDAGIKAFERERTAALEADPVLGKSAAAAPDGPSTHPTAAPPAGSGP